MENGKSWRWSGRVNGCGELFDARRGADGMTREGDAIAPHEFVVMASAFSTRRIFAANLQHSGTT